MPSSGQAPDLAFKQRANSEGWLGRLTTSGRGLHRALCCARVQARMSTRVRAVHDQQIRRDTSSGHSKLWPAYRGGY